MPHLRKSVIRVKTVFSAPSSVEAPLRFLCYLLFKIPKARTDPQINRCHPQLHLVFLRLGAFASCALNTAPKL
jgi:hypothetical protein